MAEEIAPFGLAPVEIDPLTGVPLTPSDYAQGKFQRIASTVGSGLKNWVATPGDKLWGTIGGDPANVVRTVPLAERTGPITEEEVFRDQSAARGSADWGAGTAFGMLGVGAPAGMFAKPGQVGVFGGRLAKTADLEKLAQAESMTAKGAFPDEVWTQTGWFQGPEGKWRFEIPDDKAKLTRDWDTASFSTSPNKVASNRYAQVGRSIEHPELLEAYPDIAPMGFSGRFEYGPDTRLQRHAGTGEVVMGPGGGEYLPGRDSISASGFGANRADAKRGVLSTSLHELQHAIQQREGFAPGGNPETYTRGYKSIVRDAEAQIEAINERLKSAVGTPRYDELLEMRSELVKNIHDIEGPHGIGTREKGFADYRRLAGEVEARNVQHRMDWDAQKRRDIPPAFSQDTPIEAQTVLSSRGGSFGSLATMESRGPLPMDEASRMARAAEQGYTLDAYHGTRAPEFDAFKRKQNDVGVHFGTAEQAGDRLDYLGDRRGDAGGERVMPVKLKLNNPLRIDDMGAWGAENLHFGLKDLATRGGVKFRPEEVTAAFHSARNESGRIAAMRDLLESRGYDGLVYKNEGETGGSTTFRKRIDEAREKLNEAFGPKKYSFSREDQQHPAYREWTEANAAYDKHRKENGQDSYIALRPNQARSRFAKFDPANEGKSMILGAGSRDPAQTAAGTVMQATRDPGSIAPRISRVHPGQYDIHVGDQFAGTASVAGDGTKPFVSAVKLEAPFQRQGIGTKVYEQIESDLGRSLVPSPLGLSEAATGFWKKRMAGLPAEKRQAAVDEALALGREYGLTDAQMKDRLAPFSIAPGIRAYHGSPHDFDRFDLSKIGTGEGAQAYGHGLYFAENEGVARSYRDALARSDADILNDAIPHMVGQLRNQPGVSAEAIVKKNLAVRPALAAHASNPEAVDLIARTVRGRNADGTVTPDALNAFRSLSRIVGEKANGRMYEVNINAKPEQFLDWDRPLAGPQIDAVRNAASEIRPGLYDRVTGQGKDLAKWSLTEPEAFNAPKTGETAYYALKRGFGGPGRATDALREAGIPGIRYLDQGSRVKVIGPELRKSLETRLHTLREDLANAEAKGVGQPDVMRSKIATLENQLIPPKETSNYVLFDDSLVDILRKYALPGAVGGGAAFGSLTPGDGS